jgi:hypothetical protein
MITPAVKVSPMKVRLDQMNGFVYAVKEFIFTKNTLLIPVKRIKANPVIKIINKIKFIL